MFGFRSPVRGPQGGCMLCIYVLCDRWGFSKYAHYQKYRVQKRIAGQLYRWTFNSVSEALAKRDAIFGLVATE